MTPTAFGTLMAVEPAIGVLLGLLVLHQTPTTTQIVGILLVVLAGAAAQHGGRRHPEISEPTRIHSELDLIGWSPTAPAQYAGADAGALVEALESHDAANDADDEHDLRDRYGFGSGKHGVGDREGCTDADPHGVRSTHG